ncbi:TlpA family protein disulfide reductase [Butyricimonas hominis]|jgi:thioredoxin family protein|uniref:TlpA family protein disulfide reductase n=1 Tax=Butyricimonas hominis TaxID=2763032 RepID=A0ABR7D5N6_9BACT|nr:TlpA disulfide reductase family protein [Butyricimonas hominis]MBC5623067.1 TlpA family protein disulfide reductase [Butyricimonas hominis]
MKRVLVLVISLLLGAQVSTFAQEVKKDTLTEEQKAYFEEHKLEIARRISNAFAGFQELGVSDSKKEKQRADSIRKVVETKYKPGAPSADFKFKDVNGKVVSLKDLRGKYVYIDVWATWCGPCCAEIPFLQKLEEKMHGKNMTFVSISWDRNRNDWVKALEKKELDGIQLHFGGDDTFFKEYGIEFIPRFILLDKKGKVVNAYMTRPSDPKTEEMFKTLRGL